MDSGNPPEGKCTFINQAPAQNIVGGNNNTNTQNVTWSSPSASAVTVGPYIVEQATGFGPLQEDGCFSFSKPKINAKSAGNLILRERDVSSFPTPPKAYALILNIFHYDQKSFDPKKDVTRYGSDVDVENLVKKFKMFNVGVYTPKTHTTEENTAIFVAASDIERWITEFKTTVELKKSGGDKMACFVCIMGHGTSDGRLVDSRNKDKIFIEKDIFRQFNNERFPAMINNPKIFFTNCCRGNADSLRVTLATDSISGKSPQTVPNLSDFLIGWSTAPEHFSHRDINAGSKFIEELCTVLQRHYDELILEYGSTNKQAEQTDIETILKAVVEKMRQFTYTDENGQKHSQTPIIENQSFGRFLWLIDDFHYSRKEALPSYLLR